MDKDTVAALLPFVSSKRQQKILLYRREIDQIASLFSELLLRYILETIYLLDRNKIEIFSLPNHKPYLLNCNDIYFSISHSGNKIALSICDTENGIDIQQIEFIDNATICLSCSREELSFLQAVPTETMLHHFFRLWTMKECYVKALGDGFIRNPNEISIPIRDKYPSQFKIDHQNIITEYVMSDEYYLSVCTLSDIQPLEPVNKNIDLIIKHFLP